MAFEMEIDQDLSNAIDLIHNNRSEGLRAIEKLAKRGNRSAVLCMGLYLSEDSSTSDDAVAWLEEAERFDSPDAAWNLAMIAREKGDSESMKKWIDRAASLGEPDAIKVRNLGYDVSSVLSSYE